MGWSGEDTRLGTQQTLAQRAAYLCVGEWVGQVKIHGWLHRIKSSIRLLTCTMVIPSLLAVCDASKGEMIGRIPNLCAGVDQLRAFFFADGRLFAPVATRAVGCVHFCRVGRA